MVGEQAAIFLMNICYVHNCHMIVKMGKYDVGACVNV